LDAADDEDDDASSMMMMMPAVFAVIVQLELQLIVKMMITMVI